MSTKKKNARSKIQTRKEKKAAVHNIVKTANELTYPMAGLVDLKTYKTNTIELSIECLKATQATSEIQVTVFQLLKNNMKDYYEQSSWKWSDETKQKELSHEEAWLLLGYQGDNIMAFSHFRFEVEGSYPILYCYELQIDLSVQRKGIGKHFMHILERIAIKLKLVKVILTVFKHNQPALDFYTKSLKFRLDETSPRDDDCCYVILSKSMERKF